ncbi:MAG: pyruvate:ferredoxin (flavodoxin) oxidoreductase [Oscillospiraceae bacterium]|nr:pyruvate:ferredoxin (flavodoxin) oxidoreductase [Oscillospiraceae bacterium]
MARQLKTMDGNTAAAHVSYAFTEVAAIYPITPSSVMAELTDIWSNRDDLKNIFGQSVKIVEMQSEAGAASAVHGSLQSGALTTTYTASQGLLLMIPGMYKMAGELLPGVIHVSARALASHALSIFGDHSDVMSCRSTGYAMMAATNPQEVMDLGAVAHLASIKGRVPFLHFFDGFRTSHEAQKIEIWDFDTLNKMVDHDAVQAFRDRALNPDHPVLRGTAQNPDIFFQAREACNSYYDNLPAIVEEYMGKVNAEAGTDYKLFNYYGAADAERIIVAMGSVCDTIEETIDYMNKNGEKVGLVKVRLYRPFVGAKFVAALPKTCKTIAVLDRTKEPGALGEPLYQDVMTSLAEEGVTNIKVAGGRYGLGSKDVPPSNIIAVYKNLNSADMKKRFTIGINDDVTNLSLPIDENPDTTPEGNISCKFWGLGADGTVGANKNTISIIGDKTDDYAQAYFSYDSKKSGGVTISHLRFGKQPIKSTYYINKADFVACHNPSYVDKYDMTSDIKPGGTFLLNCAWDVNDLDKILPSNVKRHIANNDISVYTIDGIALGEEVGLGKRINTILQAAFFKLNPGVMDIDKAVEYMKAAATKSYSTKGEKVVAMNHAAIDIGVKNVKKIDVPEAWKTASGSDLAISKAVDCDRPELKAFVEDVMMPIAAQKGDLLPVSTFANVEDGTFPQGSAAFEKRGVAVNVPKWIPENCIQCNQCSYVCPHAVCRPFVLDAKELAAAPEGYQAIKMMGKGCDSYQYAINLSVNDCYGCDVCANVCPSKQKALVMEPLHTQLDEQTRYDYAFANVTEKEEVAAAFNKNTVKGSQFLQPLLEFSGACAGCGETPYAKLITQLYGDRMYIGNATGCSSIWGGNAPSTPYTVNKEGKGPTWCNSLFEDTAEFSYGMLLGVNQRRDKVESSIKALQTLGMTPDCFTEWLDNKNCGDGSKAASKKLEAWLDGAMKDCGTCGCDCDKHLQFLNANRDMFVKKSVWAFGGDGWAYDIGFGGLDHVIASGDDINMLVFDTEVYSNTGGQASKASQIGQVAQFAAAGKGIDKKDLASMLIAAYPYAYVAQIAMGASQKQTIDAIVEAESYPGPSIVIAYSPCVAHGMKGGLGISHAQTKRAVEAGYWHNFRYDPRLKAEGKQAFRMDSKAPTASYKDFISDETRYTSLKVLFPERAEELFDRAAEAAADKYKVLEKYQDIY